MKLKNNLFYFPLCFLLVGIIIHIMGLFDIIHKDNYSVWNVWVHFSMLLINTIAFYGLLSRKKWGYYGALAIFILFGATQLVLGLFHIVSKGKIPFDIQNYGTILVCIVAVVCLFAENNLLETGSEKYK